MTQRTPTHKGLYLMRTEHKIILGLFVAMSVFSCVYVVITGGY